MSAANWRHRAACLGMDGSIFYPVGIDSARPDVLRRIYAPAAAVCAECPVRGECLDLALATHDAWGYLGGTTPEERGSITRSRQRRNARAKTTQEAS